MNENYLQKLPFWMKLGNRLYIFCKKNKMVFHFLSITFNKLFKENNIQKF